MTWRKGQRLMKKLLRRKRDMVDDGVLDTLLSLSNQALSVQDRDTLLGIEGIAAKIYFDNLPPIVKRQWYGI